MLKFKNFLLLIIILFSNYYLSNIWIEPKDELKIKKLELYSAKNNINIAKETAVKLFKLLEILEQQPIL